MEVAWHAPLLRTDDSGEPGGGGREGGGHPRECAAPPLSSPAGAARSLGAPLRACGERRCHAVARALPTGRGASPFPLAQRLGVRWR